MEKLVQEQKHEQVPQASFEEICPAWNKIISEQGGYDKVDVSKQYQQGKRISSYCNCIVGEAFGLG